jgi:hypothetical protein
LGKQPRAENILKKLVDQHKDYAAAHFMLSAALCINNEVYNSEKALEACQLILSKEVIAIAADQLINRLNINHQEEFGRRFKSIVSSAINAT